MSFDIRHRIKSPIFKNLIAKFSALGIALINQIVLVPFYIYYWGNELYSDWIVISSLTIFFSMTDVGLNSVIWNKFSIEKAAGKMETCNKLLVTNIIIVSIVFFTSIFLVLIYLSSFNICEQMNLNDLSRRSASWVFIFTICHVFLKMYSSIESAIFQSSHKAHVAIYIDQIAQVLTILIILLSLILGVPMPLMCLFMCIPYLLTIFIKHKLSKQLYKYRFSFRYFDGKMIKQLLIPSFSFMSFPASNAILLQGFTLLVNKFFGADATVLYNTTRTMCNFVKQINNQITFSFYPEFTIAYGEKNYNRLSSLLRKCRILSLSFIVLILLMILILGPYIYDIWTRGAVEFSYPLMCSFLIVLLVEAFWLPSMQLVLSTNNHQQMCLWFLISSILSFVCCFTMIKLGFGLNTITYSQLIVHLITGYKAIKTSRQIEKGLL